MQIKSLLTETLTLAKVEGVSKKRIINIIAESFADAYDGIDADELFLQLIAREKLGSTGLGQGIAIPHCRFSGTDRTLCLCITLDKAIDFDAVDQNPVDVIFAMVVPEDEADAHLQTLASLAASLQNEAYVARLRAATTPAALFQAATAEQ